MDKKETRVLPLNLESVSLEEVETILNNNSYSKRQLVELGYVRFGISRSCLRSQNRLNMIQNILSSVEQERTLSTISQMAKEAGRNMR